MGLARLYEYEIICDRCNCKSTFKDYYQDKQLYEVTSIETTNGGFHMKYYVLANVFDCRSYYTLCYNCFVDLLSPQKSGITINQLNNIKALPVYYKSDVDNSIKFLWHINTIYVNGNTMIYNFLDVNNSRILYTIGSQNFIDCGHVDTIEELQNRCNETNKPLNV